MSSIFVLLSVYSRRFLGGDVRLKNTDFATTLRGIAAVCVIIAHYFGVFWGNQPAVSELTRAPIIEGLSIPSYLLWLHPHYLFNWGAFGVALFFLVSGFVIPYSLDRSSRLQFIIGRFFRIVPLYAVGFSITLLSIWMSVSFFGTEWPYSLKQVLIHYVPGIRDLLWSANIDGIIWTLEIEMKFYLVCLFGVMALRQRSSRFFLIPMGILVVALYLISRLQGLSSGNYMAIYFACLAIITAAPYLIFMFIGSVFHFAFNGYLTSEKSLFFTALLYCAYLMVLYVGPNSSQLALAGNYGLAILVFAFAASYPQLFKLNGLAKFFANISYPLYAVHGVAGYVVLSILWHYQVKAWISMIIVTILAVGVSWILHVFVEERSNKWGKRLAQKFAVGRTLRSDVPEAPALTPAE